MCMLYKSGNCDVSELICLMSSWRIDKWLKIFNTPFSFWKCINVYWQYLFSSQIFRKVFFNALNNSKGIYLERRLLCKSCIHSLQTALRALYKLRIKQITTSISLIVQCIRITILLFLLHLLYIVLSCTSHIAHHVCTLHIMYLQANNNEHYGRCQKKMVKFRT